MILKKLIEKKYPWLIVFGHRPLYCSNPQDGDCDNGDSDFSRYLRQKLEPLLLKYRVNVFIESHKHDYERMYPVYNAQPSFSYNNPIYPVYVLNGAGGNREGTDELAVDRPNWSAKAIRDWGYGILTVYNDTHLDWSFYKPSSTKPDDYFLLISNGS